MNVFKKVIKHGNSLGVLFPSKVKHFGFIINTSVKLKIEENKITIIPEEKKEYYSRIKGFLLDESTLIPKWNDRNKSYRFEELKHLIKEGIKGYDLRIYFDHEEDKYIAFVCGNSSKDKWFGNYITEKEYHVLLKEESKPFDILLKKKNEFNGRKSN